jgi:TRAP-type transport system small permease protein
MSIRKAGKQFEAWVHQISRILMYVTLVVLFIIMLIQMTDVVGRYLFDKPLKATMDYLELGMAIIVFWGLAYCASENNHVRVDVFTVKINKRVLNVIDRTTFTFGAFILALITWRLALRAWGIIQNPPGPVTYTMFVPYWPFLIMAAIGCFFFFLETLIKVFNPDSGKPTIPAADSESSAEKD